MTTTRPYYSPEPSYATAEATPRSASPATTITSITDAPNVPSTVADQTLKPGVYRILNDSNPTSVIDLSGYDLKTIIAYGSHEGKNQQWELSRLGPGYSIRSLHNGSYMIATPYPVSWAVEADDFESGIWRIRWPNSPFIFDYPEGTGHIIHLSNRYPFKPTRLWRLVPVQVNPPPPTRPSTLELVTIAPRQPEPGPQLTTTADTVIDVEGLKLGGNGEMSITTTTTTVTTSVTVVKRLGCP